MTKRGHLLHSKKRWSKVLKKNKVKNRQTNTTQTRTQRNQYGTNHRLKELRHSNTKNGLNSLKINKKVYKP